MDRGALAEAGRVFAVMESSVERRAMFKKNLVPLKDLDGAETAKILADRIPSGLKCRVRFGAGR